MSSAPSRAIKLFGTEETPAETVVLWAGPMTAELENGSLRYIRYGGQEALRAISYVVRDKLWGTYNPELRDLALDQQSDSFTVTYEAVCKDEDQEFRYRARITGSADGTLRFEGLGTPVTDFLTNRTGFVVLHGVEGISGAPVEVLHVDGTAIGTRFPDLIDPKQPIMDIRALTHRVTPTLKATCTMEGDAFEMEDQRNWTDASYKTYVRPLGLPFPYSLPAGEAVEQSVTLSFDGLAAAASSGEAQSIEVSVGAPSAPLPRFGMALEGGLAEASLARSALYGLLKPAFLSCYFDGREVGTEALEAFREIGGQLGCALALEAVVPEGGDPREALAAIADETRAAGLEIASLAVSPEGDLNFVMPGTVFPDDKAFRALFTAAREAFPAARIGGGNFVYFTEMNRKPPPLDALDFLCHGTCALVHAADDRSVTETLECLPYVIASGRALAGGKEYRIGPGSLGSRTSPFGGPTTPNPTNARVTMTRNDPRQRGLLGAAWHLGYAARMAEGGVDSVILGAPIGPFGLAHHPMDYPQPWYDEAGGLYPAFHVMRPLYAASGSTRRETTVSTPRDLQALAYEDEAGLTLWLANLTGGPQAVSLSGLGPGAARLALLDEEGFETCAADPDGLDALARRADARDLELGPYGVARLTFAT